MRRLGRALGMLLAVSAVALALPAAGWAHAALLRTFPTATGVQNTQPHEVRLTFSEAVEPRFAIVSVTDASGAQQTTGRPTALPTDRTTLVTPVENLAQGWYLVFWRAISADGHPVRGAFTFAIGPVPGTPPQFVIPSISETAATPQLIVARWAVFVSLLAAVGLFAFRTVVVRPLPRPTTGRSLRAITLGLAASLAAALVATPVYVLLATAQFDLRSWTDLGELIPLMRASAFGRAFTDLELLLAFFATAAGISILLERGDRPVRSVAELLSQAGAWAAAAASLVLVSLAGHAPQSRHRWISLPFDSLHLAAGAIWLGGLIGVVALWSGFRPEHRLAGLAIVVPRFSNTAFVSVLALIASGTVNSIVYLPTVSSLWQTSYGKSLLAKILLLVAAMLLAAVNLLRTKPRLQAAARDGDGSGGAAVATLLRRLVGGEVLIVSGAVAAAALLTSLPPPAQALSQVGAAEARVGPGPVSTTVSKGPYRLDIAVGPNRAAVPNAFSVRVSRNGRPLTGAAVTLKFLMLDMDMGQFAYVLKEQTPGYYVRSEPAFVMAGHWGLQFQIAPPSGPAVTVTVVDRALG